MGPELVLAITGVAVQGLELCKKIDACYTDGGQASKRIQHIQANLKSTNYMLDELKVILKSLDSGKEPRLHKIQNDLTNFLHEISMIRDVFTLLATLIRKYDMSGSDGPLLQAGRFTPAQKLNLKQKFEWARDDLKRAEKLGQMLAGHMANLSFAIQIMNTAALTSIGNSIERDHDESEERHREMLALQISNMRKSDLENNPQFQAYLESIAADFNSSIHTDDTRDLEDDATDNVVFQAEIDRDKLVLNLRRMLQEKMHSDRELSRAMQANTKIEEELKLAIEVRERNRKREILIIILLLILWNQYRHVPATYIISLNLFSGFLFVCYRNHRFLAVYADKTMLLSGEPSRDGMWWRLLIFSALVIFGNLTTMVSTVFVIAQFGNESHLDIFIEALPSLPFQILGAGGVGLPGILLLWGLSLFCLILVPFLTPPRRKVSEAADIEQGGLG